MDGFILINVATAFFLFFIFHFIIFRLINASKVFQGLVYVFAGSGFIDLIVSFFINQIFYHFAIELFLISYLLIFLLYTNLTFFYILAFFGISVTSLRINLLGLIEKSGRKGLTYHQVLKTYNTKVIVKNRLKRLVGSKEIRKDKDKYKIVDRFSFFKINTYIFLFMRRLYKD